MKKRAISYILLTILLLILIIFFIRLFSETQIDDISPEIPCKQSLLEKADVYYIIPRFNNKNISENQEWCKQILNTNKKLAMHGVTHEYNEFLTNRDENYLQQGIDIFKACFNQSPKSFKPPQLAISKNNKQLIKNKMNLDILFNQLFHKVYHCQDTGKFPNKFIDWF